VSDVILAATGHRPDKLGGYGRDVQERLEKLAYDELLHVRPAWVISGLALGWDTAIARAALKLQIPLAAAIPFEGQESKWPDESQVEYHAIRARASWLIVVCPGGYGREKMQIRNRWMVDYSSALLALWNGTAGGTANTVRYAGQVGRATRNCWDRWSACYGAPPRAPLFGVFDGIDVSDGIDYYDDSEIPY
jgi:uncharacterized phage-like protein YoqJ